MAETDPVDLPDDFDTVLRQELSIEPSPAFAARIRADASALRPRSSWTSWLLPLAGAAALAVATFVWIPFPGEPVATLPPPASAPPASAPAVTAESTPSRAAAATTKPLASSPSPARRATARSQKQSTVASAASSAVVVDQNQRAALRALVGMIDQGRLTAEAFAKTTPQSTEPIADQVVPITIAPVPVSTIAPGGVLQNDRQRQ